MAHAVLHALGILAAVVAFLVLAGAVALVILDAHERRHDGRFDDELEQLLNDADAHRRHDDGEHPDGERRP